jgi:fucose 4-O-acetylase-like acetyltransferase
MRRMGEPGGAAPGRYRAIDAIKAAAIVAVVFTHARGELLPSARSWDFWLCASWTLFQVPAFLFASGFLCCRSEPESVARVRERWLRVVAPYLMASGVAYLAGVARATSVSDLAFQLATASPLGVYYYVLLIAVVSPLAWPLSRVGKAGAWVLLGVCVLAMLALAAQEGEGGGPVGGWFWSLRNPLDHFSLGFFVAGWLVRLGLQTIERAWSRRRGALGFALAAALAAGPIGAVGVLPGPLAVPLRIAYTLAVVGSLAALSRGPEPGRAVVFLSEASLAIYLYHRIFQRLLETRLTGWPEPAGTLGLVLAGLGGGVAVALLGRRWLGAERARLWLGA